MDSDDDVSDLTDLSSELSSLRSSPSPPPNHLSSPPPLDYPSPQSSQDNCALISNAQPVSRKRPCEDHDLPRARKRRSLEARPRTTVHLDLHSPDLQPPIDQATQLALLLKTLRKRRKIVVIAGAGISTSAGGELYSSHCGCAQSDFDTVPDFRSSNGLFNTLKSENKLKASGKHLFDASVYQTNDSTESFHEMVRTLSRLVSGAKPTAFHMMLATLASEGRLMRLYTQNVDGIDTSLPPLATTVPLERKGPWPRTIQLHGSLEKMVCSKCNALKDFDPALFDGPIPPLCVVCEDLDKIRTEEAGKRSHGIGRLRPRMVLYNESNPDDEAIGMVVKSDLRSRPDAVIVVGTSLEIPGVKRIVREMCGVVRGRRDGVAIWINRGPPPVAKEFEDCWDLVVAGDCDKVAHRANMRRWDDEGNDYKECTESEAEHAKSKGTQLKVIVKAARSKSPTPQRSMSRKKSSSPVMMPTPGESPQSKATKLPNVLFQFPPLDKKAKPAGTNASKKLTKSKLSKIKSAPGISKSKKQSGLAFKVTKNRPLLAAPPTTPKKDSIKPARPHYPSPTGPEKARKLLESINEPVPVPMVPLSPNSAKSNGPLTPPENDDLLMKVTEVELPLPVDLLTNCNPLHEGT